MIQGMAVAEGHVQAAGFATQTLSTSREVVWGETQSILNREEELDPSTGPKICNPWRKLQKITRTAKPWIFFHWSGLHLSPLHPPESTASTRAHCHPPTMSLRCSMGTSEYRQGCGGAIQGDWTSNCYARKAQNLLPEEGQDRQPQERASTETTPAPRPIRLG